MSAVPKKLLAVMVFMANAKLTDLYRSVGFDVTTTWDARKAVALVRKLKPDVIVADFYFQSDFRDRLSNLESVLAAAQPLKDTRVLIFYEPDDMPALQRVRARMRIDAALPMPASEEAIRAVVGGWAADQARPGQ